jgi:hypothetical protein
MRKLIRFPSAEGIRAAPGARPVEGEILAANVRTKAALKGSVKMNCPLDSEFFCRIHPKLP